jgi:hypothetical protein
MPSPEQMQMWSAEVVQGQTLKESQNILSFNQPSDVPMISPAGSLLKYFIDCAVPFIDLHAVCSTVSEKQLRDPRSKALKSIAMRQKSES